MKFTKMQGCGNDYIYFNCFKETVLNPQELAARISDRHFGVGGDGIVLICPSAVADAKMRMFNADGSEGKMCGNAIRCIGKYLYDHKMVNKEVLTVETLSGIKTLALVVKNGSCAAAEVAMGHAVLSAPEIPVLSEAPLAVNMPLMVGAAPYTVTCVSMGNPHCVVFCDEIENLALESIGPLFENHPSFPERINTEFVRIIDGQHIEMRVWERGSGETLACGTGACASVVACVLGGFCQYDSPVTVRLLGGELEIRYMLDGGVTMKGPAETVFEGEI